MMPEHKIKFGFAVCKTQPLNDHPETLAGIIAVPSLFPNEIADVVRDALLLRLPEKLCRSLLPHERAAWARGA